MKTPRRMAADALLRVDTEGGYSNLVLDSALKKEKPDKRDGALATALFYGCLERRVTLDHCIEAYAKRPVDAKVREVLRIALYQILYMDTIPHSAAVSEAVEEVKRMGAASASGFVNGVLRAFLRDGVVVPPVVGDETDRLSVTYSCSKELAGALLSWYGPAAESILAASLGRPEVYIRVNTLMTDPESLTGRLSIEDIILHKTGMPQALLCSGGDIASTKAYRRGFFHIQDLSSQQAVAALDPQPGERILDMCAAPGGKSFTAAQHMQGQGEIISCDISAAKLPLIKEGAKRLGIKMISPVENDATVFNPALGLFDRVLCDAPCSGLGVMRRKPEIKYKNPVEFETLPTLQYKILESSSQYLKEGGTLVYSTCTISPLENRDVISRFLAAHPEFVCENGENGPGRTILPGEKGQDGFFIAKLKRLAPSTVTVK